MRNKFKKLITALAFSAVLLSSLKVNASSVIHDVKERHDIATGVQHVQIDRFTNNGWIDIEVLKLDTKNSFSNLTPLISGQGVSKRAVLSDMINSNGAVAGINGDFFETTSYPMALGSLYGDNKLILSTPEVAFSRNSFYITKDGKGGVGNLNNNIIVTNIGKGINYSINALNKISKPYSAISILDSNWGAKSPGNSIGTRNTEVLIVNNRVVDKRTGGVSFQILPGTYVLTQVGTGLDSLSIGDTISINYGGYENLAFSVGGGNILVSQGSVLNNPKFSKTRAPRTAIGINSTNTEVLLVTVDGRNNTSIGMSEQELAEFMKSIGSHHALNLDGGGSTTMGIKYSGDEKATIVNYPSDGSERPIVSGVGIKSSAPVSEPNYLKITPSEKSTFIGFSYPITVEVFDQYHNKLQVNPESISISSESGNISGLNFNPSVKGPGKITASYAGITGATDVFVHSEMKELILDVGSLQMTNGKIHIFETIYGKDDLGYKKKINASQVQFSATEGIGIFEGNKFTAQGDGVTGVITANYNGVIRNIPISVGTQKENIFGFDSIENATVSVNPNEDTKITASVILDSETQDENPSTALVYSITPQKEAQSASINYKGGISLGTAQYVGLWIKGDSSGGKVIASFRDANGKTGSAVLIASVDFNEWKYVEALVPASLNGNIFLDKLSITISDEVELVSSIKFDGLIAGIKLPLDWELAKGSSVSGDPRNFQGETEGASRISITSLSKNGGDNTQKLNHLQNKNVAVIFNGASPETMAGINAGLKFNGNDVHNIKTSNGTAFITLQSNQNGIRSANAAQWKPFMAAMENADYKNIVIMMQHDPENLTGAKEKSFFFDIIDKAVKSGKNVFIVSPGNTNSVEWLSGYRKVSLTGYGNAVLDINIKDGNLSYVMTRY